MSDEIKAAREWLAVVELQYHAPSSIRTLRAAIDALEREPELIARVGELGRIGIKQEQRIAALEARLARVREEVARMRRAVEIMAGVESVAERVAQLRLVVARFDAALDGEGTK
jgi:hypothetical protein